MPILKKSESGRYTIKGVPSRDDGEKLKEFFRSKGFEAPIFQADRPEDLFRIVIIGEITSEDARQYATELGIEFVEE